jgi:hypothetical protein
MFHDSYNVKDMESSKRGFLMKQAEYNSTSDLLHKIENIEREIMVLKKSVLNKITPNGKKIVSLKGILKGVHISENDMIKAKKSLYSKTGI